MYEFTEGRGRLILFFDEYASAETRFHFEESVRAHANRRALDGSVELVRFLVCSNGHPVPDDYVKLLLAQGKREFKCPCEAIASLVEPKIWPSDQAKEDIDRLGARKHWPLK